MKRWCAALLLCCFCFCFCCCGALDVAELRVGLSNTTVAAEFARFGFGFGGGTASLRATNAAAAATSGAVVANVTLLGCTLREADALNAASAAGLCSLGCAFVLPMGAAERANASWAVAADAAPLRLRFFATNLACTNATPTPPEDVPRAFVLQIAFVALSTPAAPHPQLSAEDARQPEMHAAFAIVAAACTCAALLFLLGVWLWQRRLAVAGERRAFVWALLAALGCATLHGSLGAAHWSSFAASGAPSVALAYFAALFNAAAHALALTALFLWLRGGTVAAAAAAPPLLQLDAVWPAAGLSAASLCFAFYQTELPGWSAGLLSAVLAVWVTDVLLANAAAPHRVPAPRHGATDSASGDEDDVSATLAADDDADSVPELPAALCKAPWRAWTWFVCAFAAAEVAVVSIPPMLPWYEYWARFEPAVFALSCLAAVLLLSLPSVSRPPPRVSAAAAPAALVDLTHRQTEHPEADVAAQQSKE